MMKRESKQQHLRARVVDALAGHLLLDAPDAVLVEGDASAHDGPGWYYYDSEYPDEGSVGAFGTAKEAREHALAAGYVVPEENGP